MGMNLVVDIGNTRMKVAVFEEAELIEVRDFATSIEGGDAALLFVASLGNGSVKRGIVSNVAEEMSDFMKGLKLLVHEVVEFNAGTVAPIRNLYKTPLTLGSDRLPAAVFASEHFKGEAALVVDAGTCIKYNFVSPQGAFIGGGIAPGIGLRFKSLHDFTARLPLVNLEEGFNELVGNDTVSSILMGVQLGIVTEVDGIIDRYRNEYGAINVLLTGGDYSFFEKRLKNRIFAEPFLVLKGLNLILNFTNG